MKSENNPTCIEVNEVDLALCRSALYEALALGFRSPDVETLERLVSEEQNAALVEIASVLDFKFENSRPERLSSAVDRLKSCADAQSLETLQTWYGFLFGHTAQPKVPLYETEYEEETLFRQPQELGDIAGFYNAFGLTWNPDPYERIDHIGGQCEFLSFLTRKEAYALEQQDTSMIEETRKAQKLFLRDHLGRFVPSFSNLLKRENPDGFYGTLGRLCYELIQRECDYYGIPTGPEQLRFRSTELADDCFTCGPGDELIRTISFGDTISE
jgi:DMSO reductase family type II enzyme chaperone